MIKKNLILCSLNFVFLFLVTELNAATSGPSRGPQRSRLPLGVREANQFGLPPSPVCTVESDERVNGTTDKPLLQLIGEYKGENEENLLNKVRARLRSGERLYFNLQALSSDDATKQMFTAIFKNDFVGLVSALNNGANIKATTLGVSPVTLAERGNGCITSIIILILAGAEIPPHLYPEYLSQISDPEERKKAESRVLYYPVRTALRLKELFQEFNASSTSSSST